jgi:tetratricopeptide (TPR) repeat protein
MKRKITILSVIFSVLIVSSLTPQADTGQQKGAADKLAPGQKISDKPATINKGYKQTPVKPIPGKTPKPVVEQSKPTSNSPRILPAQVANPNLASPLELDKAIYVSEEFFGTTSRTKRAYSDAHKEIDSLISRYPKDPRLQLTAAWLDERLENFDKAILGMKQYVALSGNSAPSMRRLANFYHNRAMFKAQVETLQQLASTLKVEEREPIYREIISIVRDHEVKGFSIEDAYKELLASDKENVGLVKSYVEELALKKRYKEATEVLNTYQAKYPKELNYFLEKRANIYEMQGDKIKAEAVYRDAFDPLWSSDISTKYYELLRRFGRYRNYRRDLQSESTRSASFSPTARLFNLYAYEENRPLAFNLLKNYEAKRGEQANWKREELEILAGLYISIGNYDEASRYLYTLYLSEGMKPGSKEKEKYLSKLFQILIDSGSQPVRLSSGDLSLYSDIAKLDQNPGLLNGVLSLILSDAYIKDEFEQKEASAASYFNRAFAYRIFNSFKQEYSNSSELPVMYDYLMSMFAGFGEHKLVITLGKEFQTKFPQAPNYNQVTLKIADAHVALGQRDAERALLSQLLDKIAEQNANRVLLPSSRTVKALSPEVDALIDQVSRDIQFFSDTYNPVWMAQDNGNENYNENSNTYSDNSGINYSQILERIVASLANEGKKQDILKFFWGEIKKHPKEQGLYERTLKWLETARLFEEQLKIYTAAINNFQDNSWYHSLSRWYIRNKKKTEFQAYSKEIVETLDQEDIREYLDRFVLMKYGKVTDINYDSKFYFELYSYALKRFPGNVAFVNGLLRYYAVEKNWAEWERLSFEYYSSDPGIQENLLRYLASNKKLLSTYQQARQKASTSLAYQQFAADAATKLSHFDEALDTYKLLVANYPGETRYSLKLADLMRSFGYQGDKFSEESAKVYLQLARIYPTNHEYKTKAGEVFADMSDFARARQVWDTILTNELGVSNTYLEVASIYWDYYQYDDAIRVINNYRDNTGDKTALAYKMGAIYEGKNDWKRAINEYVSVLAEPGVGKDVAVKRLVQLAPRRDFAQVIANSYSNQASANPDNWLLSLGYSEYLRSAGRESESDNFLRGQIAKTSNIEYLEAIRDIFHRERLPQDEEQTFARLIASSRDDKEALKYRLQQADFYEQRRDTTKATAIFDQLLSQYPNNLGVIQESGQFFARAGLTEKTIALFKGSSSRAKGDYRKQFTLLLARELEKANKLDEAEQTLRAWYSQNPLDNDFFRQLVIVLGKANKQEALVELYTNALKQPSTSGLSDDESKNYIVGVRLAMVEILAKLNRHSEVVDQYIELINRQFDNAALIDSAFRYAQANNQLDRFKAYYEDLSKKSFKDYRWNLVLSAIYAANGEIPKQIDQYKLALTNEPQRLDLRETLATLYSREQRYDEAVAALRRNFDIDGNNPQWLTKIAKVQIQADKPDQAVATLRDSLTRNPKITAQLLFEAGKLLADRNYTKQSLDFYKEAIALIKAKPSKEYAQQEQIASYSLALVKTTTAPTAYQELIDLKTKLNSISSEDDDRNFAYNTKYALENFLSSGFGAQVMEVSTPKEKLDLAAKLAQSVKAINAFGENEEANLRRILSLAESTGLTELEESTLVKIKDLSYSVSPGKYYNNVIRLLSFYERYALYAKAAELLQVEKKLNRWGATKSGDSNSIDFESAYYEIVSDYWHKAGMADKELAVLAEYYRSRSGDATTNYSQLVQRYFTLLVELNQKDEFKQIAAKSNPHQLQLINFFILRKEKELALQAIDNSSFSQAWKSSRRAQVGLYFQDTSIGVEKAFQSSLDLKPIGQTVKQVVDNAKVLEGSDWYVSASNYGVWLSLTQEKAPQAHKYIVARVEDKPKDAVAQLELANFYINSKTFNLAEKHLTLASELAPSSPAILVTQGNYYFMQGDKEKAVANWNNLIAKRNSGLLQYNSYFDALASHKLTEQALPAVGRFLSRAITKVSWDELSPFVRKVALAGKNDNNLSKAIADTLYQVMRDNPNNIKLGEMLVQEDLITTTEAKSVIYRVMLERYQDLVVEITTTGGSYRGGEYYSTESSKILLDSHERKLIDFLIANRQFDQVRQNLTYLQSSHSELGLEIVPEWMEMAQAVVELRTGSVEKAVEALRRYVGLTRDVNSASLGVTSNKHLNAYTLLINEKQPQAADNLLYEYYQKELRLGQGTIANYTGIAGVEFRRGRDKEALTWLGKMVAILGTSDASVEAGKLAERYGSHKEAFEWRTQAARLNPAQVENRLELARNAALIGKNQLAVDTLKALIESRETTNTVRAQAVMLIPNVVGGKDGANAMLASFQNNPDYYAQLVTSGLLIAAERPAEAKLILQQASKPSTAAQARLMLASLEINLKSATAKNALQDALYSDGKALISQAIAFSIDEPNSLLVQAFVSNNQFNAALAFSPLKTKRAFVEEEGQYYDGQEDSSQQEQNTEFRSFNYQEIDLNAKQTKYLTLAELASERRKATENKLLESLIDVAIKVGDLPQAIGLIANYQGRVKNPEQYALLEGKRKSLASQVNNNQAIEEASLKLGTELTQSVLDQLLSKSIGNDSLAKSNEGEGL